MERSESFHSMKSLGFEKLCRICDKLTMILLCAIMVDCAVLGSGRVLSIGPLGLRMLLLGLLLVATVPLAIQQFSRLVRNPFLWALAGFAVWLLLEAVLGVINKNSMSMLTDDIKGFAYFAAVIPALCVINSKERVHKLMKAVMYATAILAAAAVVLLLVYNWTPKFFNWLVGLDYRHDITMFASVTSRIPRFFFKSTPYLLCGCAFSIYFAVTESKKRHAWRYPVIVALSLFALLLSYTRSIYLAVGGAAVFFVAILWLTMDRPERKRLVKMLGSSVAACLLLTVLLSVTLRADYFGYGLDRLGVSFVNSDTAVTPDPTAPTDADSTDPTEPTVPDIDDPYLQATMESDKYRALTMAELNRNIMRSPIWGHGLGKTLEVRGGQAHEYIYQDIWMKTGIIGLLLFFAPAVLLAAELIKRVKRKASSVFDRAAWLAVLLGFMLFSYFNPYMNASLGILFYCCTIGVFCVDHTLQKDNKTIGGQL